MSHSSLDKWHIVVSYDVTDDRRRNRVCRELKNFGERIQFSVFECLLEECHIERMKKRLARLIDHGSDSIRIYLLCKGCRQRVICIGSGNPVSDPEVFVV